MSKIIKTTNANARQYVQRREAFDASNTFAHTFPPNSNCLTYRYVVYSYGTHFPLFIAEWLPEDGKVQWYENADKYSRTTSKHHTQLHPLQQTMPMTTERMQTLARYGIAGVAVGRFEDVPF
jgi:hypothetical protein